MADVAENLRAWLLDDSTIDTQVGSTRVGQLRSLQEWSYPRITFFRTGTEDELKTLDSPVGEAPFRNFFDIECASEDVDAAADLAERIKTIGNNYSGSFGDMTVNTLLIEDHNDDYIPKGVYDDAAVFVSSLAVQVIGAA